MSKAKGSVLVGMVKLLRRDRKRATKLLPPQLQSYLDSRISTSQWYPEEDVVALMRAFAQLAPGDPGDVYERLGAASARSLTEGIYADVAGMRLLDARTKALWKAMHDTGELAIATQSPGTMRYELRGWDHAGPEYCAIMRGYLGEVQRLRGAASVTVEHPQCRAEGAEICAWVCRWS